VQRNNASSHKSLVVDNARMRASEWLGFVLLSVLALILMTGQQEERPARINALN